MTQRKAQARKIVGLSGWGWLMAAGAVCLALLSRRPKRAQAPALPQDEPSIPPSDKTRYSMGYVMGRPTNDHMFIEGQQTNDRIYYTPGKPTSEPRRDV